MPNPKIVEVTRLPTGTSAPNTLITKSAVNRLHLTTTTAGWLIQTPDALTPAQIRAAETAAAAAGLAVETRNDIPSSATVLDAATIFGILLALGILAMTIGLLRSETSGDVALLSATGASSTTRRAIAAASAGTLALVGAVVGVAAGYLAAIGFFRTSQLDTLSGLTSVPVASLLLILVGMPLVAAAGSWLLAGREPLAMTRSRE
jgi:putative ABC transport system permease protein